MTLSSSTFLFPSANDLICYKGHIAIYIGNDQIIEASSPRNGVRVHSVYVGYEIKGVLRPFV